MDWSRFNAVIITRHSLEPLYAKTRVILDKLPYPKVTITNPPADEYIWRCLTDFENKYDWVINIDDDAFLTDFGALYELLEIMERDGYDYCGMPDGLTYTPRDIFNPASMNPFFNIFHIPSILPKLMAYQHGRIEYSATLVRNMVPALKAGGFHPEIHKRSWEDIHLHPFSPSYEPFYPIFFLLLNAGCKPLLMYGRSWTNQADGSRLGAMISDDTWTTVLYTPTGRELLYHTWLARDYLEKHNHYTPDNNRERIDKAYELALAKLEKTITNT